jgi:NodT family efflux transporter outer membrane factor (OMF) lipoprotein
MVGPDYTQPDITLPDHYVGVTALTGDRAKVELDHWWKSFQDPTLDEIISRAIRQNLDIRSAEARVMEARAMSHEAGSGLYPQGSLDGGVSRERQSLLSPEGKLARQFPGYTRDQTLQQIDVGASWEADLAGGLRRHARAYRDEAQAAEAARMGVRISVAAEAADAYFRIRQVQAGMDLLSEQVDADRRLVQLTAMQIAEGVVTDRDEDDVKVVLEEDRADMAGLRDRLQRQGNRLDVLMGDAPGTDRFHLHASTGAAWIVPGIPADIRPAELMRRRPDVIAAERRLAARTEDIGAAMSQYYPSLSLGGLLGFERLGTGALFESAAFQPILLAGIHWRLFDFGKVDAEVAAARGGRAEALSHYRQTVLLAAEDVEDALSTLAKVDAQERRWQQVVDADTRSRASIERSFQAGASSKVDMLQRERVLLVAKRMLSVLHTDRARATVEVFRALGGGWPLGGEPSPMEPRTASSSTVTAASP